MQKRKKGLYKICKGHTQPKQPKLVNNFQCNHLIKLQEIFH